MNTKAYRILVDGNVLGITNTQTKQTTLFCVNTEEDAIRMCIQLEIIFGKGRVQYEMVELNTVASTQPKTNFELPGLNKTLENIPKGYNPEFPNK